MVSRPVGAETITIEQSFYSWTGSPAEIRLRRRDKTPLSWHRPAGRARCLRTATDSGVWSTPRAGLRADPRAQTSLPPSPSAGPELAPGRSVRSPVARLPEDHPAGLIPATETASQPVATTKSTRRAAHTSRWARIYAMGLRPAPVPAGRLRTRRAWPSPPVMVSVRPARHPTRSRPGRLAQAGRPEPTVRGCAVGAPSR